MSDINNIASCSGTPNTHPICDTEPVLMNKAANGMLFKVGPPDNEISILHAYGTPYEMGLAHGTLLKSDLKSSMEAFYDYCAYEGAEIIEKYIKHTLPEEWIEKALKYGLKVLLELEANVLTAPYIDDKFKQEIQGMADGSGVDYQDILNVQMMPELVKAHCSMIGAWGKATQGGRLLQLRALDFLPQFSVNHYPLVTVRHPNRDNGHPFLTLGWVPVIGALTGYSTTNAVSEKLWVYHKGEDTRKGIPFNFLLRDILQHDTTLDDTTRRIQEAHRTCSIFVGLGVRAVGEFRAFEYSKDTVATFNWGTPFPGYAPQSPQHPNIEDVLYIDKHGQPSSDPCLADAIQHFVSDGKLMKAQDITQICSLSQTGDNHIMVADFMEDTLYIAVATQDIQWSKHNKKLRAPAYSRQFIKLDAKKLFDRQHDGSV